VSDGEPTVTPEVPEPATPAEGDEAATTAEAVAVEEQAETKAERRAKYGAQNVSSPPTLPARALYWVVRNAVVLFSKVFWRLKVSGLEHVPKDGAFILAPGAHRSNIDTIVVAAVTRRRMRFVGKDSMWKYGWSAWFFSSMGGIPVKREGADRQAVALAREVLGGGEPIVMFPEGTRLEGPVIEADKMFDGPAFVSGQAQAVLLPVGIGGGAKAMPVGSSGLHPTKMALVIGPPIAPPAQNERGRVSRKAVSAKTEELRLELQDLFDQAMDAVGDPNPPRP
jgi:1-acyl-sn-glycerol-3-phosphate acyltransferase